MNRLSWIVLGCLLFPKFLLLALITFLVLRSSKNNKMEETFGTLNDSLPDGSYLKEWSDAEVQRRIDRAFKELHQRAVSEDAKNNARTAAPERMPPAAALRWLVDALMNADPEQDLPFQILWYHFESIEPDDVRAFAVVQREAKVEAKVLSANFATLDDGSLYVRSLRVVANLRDEEVQSFLAKNRT